jgi:hypothetical protein
MVERNLDFVCWLLMSALILWTSRVGERICFVLHV